MSGKQWTAEQVERVAAMWRNGITAARIAAKMGAGFTRSSVLGRMHRLGVKMPGRSKRVVDAPPKVEVTPPLGVVFASGATISSIETEGEAVTIFDVRDGVCRWPLEAQWGDYIDEKLFCGAACDTTRPYCAAHHAKAHTTRMAWGG